MRSSLTVFSGDQFVASANACQNFSFRCSWINPQHLHEVFRAIESKGFSRLWGGDWSAVIGQLMKEKLKPYILICPLGHKTTDTPDFEKALKPCVQSVELIQTLIEGLKKSRASLNHQQPQASDEYTAPTDTNLYIQQVVEYLGLVKGFFQQTKTENASTEAVNKTSTGSLSQLYSFCEWKDLLSNSVGFQMNAEQEYALTLLAAGITLMKSASDSATKALTAREIEMTDVKHTYQALLQAAGAFDECSVSLGQTVSDIGGIMADFSTPESEAKTCPSASSMDEWRKQQQTGSPAEPENEDSNKNLNERVPGASRLPDLANGTLSRVLGWLSLAQAEEITVFSATTREDSDYFLMAKLCIDISNRYSECTQFGKSHLGSTSSIAVEKILRFCLFKKGYYLALAQYYQGVQQYQKDDGAGCVQAIANFQRAQEILSELTDIQPSSSHLISLARSKEIVARDLDIAKARNQSIYYEQIPPPQANPPAVGLVKAIAFPDVELNPIWTSELQANFDPTKTPDRSKPTPGDCGCVIS